MLFRIPSPAIRLKYEALGFCLFGFFLIGQNQYESLFPKNFCDSLLYLSLAFTGMTMTTIDWLSSLSFLDNLLIFQSLYLIDQGGNRLLWQQQVNMY